nr:unnamed protein product [Callosobruchus analis]
MHSVLHHRARRSASDEDEDNCGKQWKRKPIMCCAESAIRALRHGDREIRHKCFQEVTGKDRPKGPHACASMEKRSDEINKRIYEVHQAIRRRSTLLRVRCRQNCQDCMEQANTNIELQGGCYSSATKLAHCFFRNLQLNCPEEQIKDKESCKLLQEELRSKEGVLPPPPPPPQQR